MTTNISIIQEHGLLLLDMDGSFDLSDLRSLFATLQDEPGPVNELNLLALIRPTVSVDLSAEQLRQFIQSSTAILGNGTQRVFVLDRKVHHGMVRMFESLRDRPSSSTSIVATIEQAAEILDIDVALLPPYP